MAKQSVPAQPTIRTTQYSNLLGVDYQSDETEIARNRSPEMVNMISDLGGNPIKRFGYRSVGDAYDGFAVAGGEEWAVKVGDDTLNGYEIGFNDDGNIAERREVPLYGGSQTGVDFSGLSRALGMQSHLIAQCQKNWFDYNIATGKKIAVGVGKGVMFTESEGKIELIMPDVSIIPTVMTMYKPSGDGLITLPEGTSLVGATEGVNILTPFRRIEYCVEVDTAAQRRFVIPNTAKMSQVLKVEVLKSDTFDWVEVEKANNWGTSAVATFNCFRPDDKSATTADVVEGWVEFFENKSPYTTVTTSGETYLVFRDATSVRVPAGVPNVRITYAPFNANTHDDIIAPHSENIGFHEVHAHGEDAEAISWVVQRGSGASGMGSFRAISGNGAKTTTSNQITVSAQVRQATSPYMIIGSVGQTFTYGTAGSKSASFGQRDTVEVEYRIGDFFDPNIHWAGAECTNYSSIDYDVTVFIDYDYADAVNMQLAYPPDGSITIKGSYNGTPFETTLASGGGQIIDTSGTNLKITYDGNRALRVEAETGGNHTTQIDTVEYTAIMDYYDGYYREDRANLFKAGASIVFDTRLFVSNGARTYYSRVSEPFKIDDNFYFDVDNDIVLFNKASSNLIIITEDTGNNTIYLASGEYDSDLGMTVYQIRASNSAVGSIAPKVGGVFNDEPLFLSSRGIFGITSNYFSEKYATARSGKINKHLTATAELKNSVGRAYNGYYYLAVGTEMYVLDGRHKDASKNGDNSYECYYFEGMPNTTQLAVIDNVLLMSDGEHTYRFNDDMVSEAQYLDNAVLDNDVWIGEPVKAKWTSLLDDDGAPQYYKTLQKKGTMVTVAPPMQTSCQVTIIKDAHDHIYVGRFSGGTFALSDSVLDGFTKKKVKKYKRLQFVVENNEAEPFGIISLVKSYILGNFAKR